MPVFYDPETGEYFRSNGNSLVMVKKMGDLTSAGDPMDQGMDPPDDALDLAEDTAEAAKGKKKQQPPPKGKKA